VTRIGIDVGGTNTDAVLLQDDRVAHAVKTPTTPDVSTGIERALARLLQESHADPGAVGAVMIGTTHFTNAVVQRRDLGQAAPLHHGVDEVRGADHHAVDLPAGQHAGRAQAFQGVQDAGRDVLAGRRLDGAHHLAFFDQDSVGVGAAHVDADASHAENTLLKSRS